MITPKNWGHEELIVNTDQYCGKKMLIWEQHRSSIHKHNVKDEVLMVESGLVWFETGDDPEHMVGQWMSDNQRIRLLPNTWHRFTGMRDSMLLEWSTHHEDSDSIRHSKGGKISDDEYRAMAESFIRFENQDRILTPERAGAIASALRAEGRSIGMVNGCFDLLHLGHIELLRQARTRCEVLFVAVNSDNSVKSLKGKNRPFVDEIGRMGAVESIRFVDYVVEAHETTCVNIVKAIKPDVYCTTTEYSDSGPESKEVLKLGGTVEVIEMIKGYNTTGIASVVKSK